ncbi:MAG: hypothetical protein R3F11_18735 [Verrucomicrobiales bacterium]
MPTPASVAVVSTESATRVATSSQSSRSMLRWSLYWVPGTLSHVSCHWPGAVRSALNAGGVSPA